MQIVVDGGDEIEQAARRLDTVSVDIGTRMDDLAAQKTAQNQKAAQQASAPSGRIAPPRAVGARVGVGAARPFAQTGVVAPGPVDAPDLTDEQAMDAETAFGEFGADIGGDIMDALGGSDTSGGA